VSQTAVLFNITLTLTLTLTLTNCMSHWCSWNQAIYKVCFNVDSKQTSNRLSYSYNRQKIKKSLVGIWMLPLHIVPKTFNAICIWFCLLTITSLNCQLSANVLHQHYLASWKRMHNSLNWLSVLNDLTWLVGTEHSKWKLLLVSRKTWIVAKD